MNDGATTMTFQSFMATYPPNALEEAMWMYSYRHAFDQQKLSGGLTFNFRDGKLMRDEVGVTLRGRNCLTVLRKGG